VTSPIRIGVQLPEVERDVRWPELLSMARAAEEVGFDSVWVGDHLLYRGDGRPERGPWDAWTLLSAVAASTERVRMGPLVACAAFHPPGIVARMAATIDEVSGGRFVLGIGAGWNRSEFDAFGIPFGERASRFEEAFDVIHRLLAGQRVTASGRFHHAEDAVLLPPPARRVPLMIGSNGNRMLRVALPHADAWNTWWDDYGNTPEGFAALNERVSTIAREVGRDPVGIVRSACALVVLDHDASERPVPDHVSPIDGPPGAMVRRLRALADAGADEAILVLGPITEGSIRSLGDVVAELAPAR
jgi:probable F420-dependent oxidoreductase